jgi:hypothetical protein
MHKSSWQTDYHGSYWVRTTGQCEIRFHPVNGISPFGRGGTL